jgi:hypothetical protein
MLPFAFSNCLLCCAYVYGAAVCEDDSPILWHFLIHFLLSKIAYVLAKTFPENVHRFWEVCLYFRSQCLTPVFNSVKEEIMHLGQ